MHQRLIEFYAEHAKELPTVKPQRQVEQDKAVRDDVRKRFQEAFKDTLKDQVKEPVKDQPTHDRAEPKQLDLPETRQRSEVEIAHDTPDPAYVQATPEPTPELTPHEKAVAELRAAYNQAVERDRSEGIDRGR